MNDLPSTIPLCMLSLNALWDAVELIRLRSRVTELEKGGAK